MIIPGQALHYAVIAALVLLSHSCGEDDRPPEISVTDVWSRPASVTGVVYMRINNRGGQDRLLSAGSGIAQHVEIHESYIKDDEMKMRHLADGIDIPANEQVEMRPGGLHIMLINLTRKLETGTSFDLTLNFEKSGSMQVRSHIMKSNP